jgi:hypothetical protein
MGLLSHVKASGECERLRLLRKEISEKVQKSLKSRERLVVFQSSRKGVFTDVFLVEVWPLDN